MYVLGFNRFNRIANHNSLITLDAVLVVEYGYLDSSFAITATGPDSDAMNFQSEFYEGTRFYNITSERLVHLNGEPRDVYCGCVVGGSSAVNGMLFDRGSAEDYDAWVWATGEAHEAEYATEWGWKNIFPAFRKSVTFHPPLEKLQEEYGMTYDMDAWGGTTPVHASFAPFQWPTTGMMLESLSRLGIRGQDADNRGRRHV